MKLLRKSPDERLGAKGGIKDIKNDVWLRGTNYDMYIKKRVKPPFKVLLTGKYFEDFKSSGNI